MRMTVLCSIIAGHRSVHKFKRSARSSGNWTATLTLAHTRYKQMVFSNSRYYALYSCFTH